MIKRKGNGDIDIDIDSLEIEDVMDITILQKFQDNFADSMNIASVTVNRDGKPVTRPSCYTNFCSKLTQSTSTGECRCAESHKKGGDEATRLGRPYVFTCHAGLTDFASPIMIDGKSIGTILCGQVVIDHPQEVDLRKKAKEIGVDEDEYVNAANDIKETEERNVQAGTEVLFIVTNALVKIGYESLRVSTVTNNLADNFSQISATMEELAASSVDVSNNQHNLNDEINIVKDISEEINTILDSIKSIADETKMLGLNAAIEAARAGEAGKGFGVVATEIRALSASSKETALTIAQLTKRIQASVDKTLETANSTLETTEQQTAAIQEVSSSIQEVSALADSLNEM